MNLRALANSIASTINPNIEVLLLRSTGYTAGPGARQIPTYSFPEAVQGQLQALDSEDLQHLDSLNIQGTLRALYISGPLAGVVRPHAVGGDIVQIDGEDWLVAKVLETWPDWTKVVVVLQNGV